MSCDGGWEEKKPKVLQQPKDGGKPCSPTMRRRCNTHVCNQQPSCNCAMGAVDSLEYAPQSKTPSFETRCHRVDGVMHVVHALEDEHHYTCRYDLTMGCECCHCHALECPGSDWSTWSACDAVTGYRTRTRRIQSYRFYLGTCPMQTETHQCAWH